MRQSDLTLNRKLKHRKVVTKITNEYIQKSEAFRQYVCYRLEKKKPSIRGLNKNSSEAKDIRKVLAIFKYEDALNEDNYEKLDDDDLALLYTCIYEGFYNSRALEYMPWSHKQVRKFMDEFNVQKENFVGFVSGLLVDHKSLGYSTEEYPYLDFKCLERPFIIRGILNETMYGDLFNRGRTSEYTADGLRKEDIEKAKKFEEENPELMEDVEDFYI